MNRGFQLGTSNKYKRYLQAEKAPKIKPQKGADGYYVMLSTVQPRQCRWPYHMVSGDLVMCGRETEGRIYCMEHRAIASAGRKAALGAEQD